jgi:hypothetical protein
MKKLNRKAVLGGLTLSLVLLGTTMSFGSTFSGIFSTKIARGSSLGVSCYCAFWGGNNNCAANNAGSQCAPSGSNFCYAYNGNCEG